MRTKIDSLLETEDYSHTIHEVESWISSVESQSNSPEKRTEKWTAYVWSHRMRVMAAAATFLVGLWACTMPVEQNETMGYVLQWTAEGSVAQADDFVASYAWMQPELLGVSESAHPYFMTFNLIASGASVDEAEEWMRQISSDGRVRSVRLLPLEGTITRPVYAAAIRSLFKVSVEVGDLSRDEVRRQITEQLKAYGIEDATVTYIENSDFSSCIDVALPPGENEELRSMRMTIRKDGQSERIDLSLGSDDPLLDATAGKSVDEIRQLIEDRLREKGLLDKAKIEVKDNKIMVKVIDEANK